MTGVSYVVTLYNKAPFIPWMIRGLAAQTGDFPRQFIFVDDGSTDGSLDLVKRLTAGWDHTLHLAQRNQGPGAATNRGVEQAVHPWLKMLDGDDMLTPYAGRLMRDVAERFEADAVYSWPADPAASFVDYDEDFRFDPEPADAATAGVRLLDDALYEVVRRGWSGSSNAFFRTAAFRAAGGCDERVFVQDWALPLRLSLHGRLVFIDTLVCVGPRTADQRLSRNGAQMIHDLSATHLGFLRDHPDLPRRIRRLMAERAAGRAWKWARRENGHGLGSRHFWRYAALKLGLPLEAAATIEASLAAFRERHPVRRPATD